MPLSRQVTLEPARLAFSFCYALAHPPTHPYPSAAATPTPRAPPTPTRRLHTHTCEHTAPTPHTTRTPTHDAGHPLEEGELVLLRRPHHGVPAVGGDGHARNAGHDGLGGGDGELQQGQGKGQGRVRGGEVLPLCSERPGAAKHRKVLPKLHASPPPLGTLTSHLVASIIHRPVAPSEQSMPYASTSGALVK